MLSRAPTAAVLSSIPYLTLSSKLLYDDAFPVDHTADERKLADRAPNLQGFPLHLYMCSKLTVGVVRIKINDEDGPSVTCALARCSGGSRPKPRRAARRLATLDFCHASLRSIQDAALSAS